MKSEVLATMPDPEENLPDYLKWPIQQPPLSREEEITLARAVRRGDEGARKRLTEANMRLVVHIAKMYRGRALTLEERIQQGSIGLMQAAERFDPEKGFRFSTYATHWIRQSIGRAIDDKSGGLPLTAQITRSLLHMEQERQRLTQERGQPPSLEQIAQAMGVSSRKLLTLMQSAQDLFSLSGRADLESVGLCQEAAEELRRIVEELNTGEGDVRFHHDIHDVVPALRASRERIRRVEQAAIERQNEYRQEAKARGLPLNTYFAIRSFEAKRQELREKLGEEPTLAQIVKELRITEERAAELSHLYRRHFTEE